MFMSAGRNLNQALTSLFRHTDETPAVLESLVQELHTDRDLCSYQFLNHPGSEDMLWGIVKLLGSEDSRIAGNGAYVLGTLAETTVGRDRIVSVCTDDHDDAESILPNLTKILNLSDTETVMNAAGTIGTLAECEEGRMWMLRQDCFNKTLDKITQLLAGDIWTASNAALVLARLTISEEGCARVLNQRYSSKMLGQLIRSLGSDEAGRGMNSAFAIGRLCDLEAGRVKILSLPDSNSMIVTLAKMLGSSDSGCCKNSCYAVSCLTTNQQGHNRVFSSSCSELILDNLAKLLLVSETETLWFASMAVHTLASQKKGCLRIRHHQALQDSLNMLYCRRDLSKDVRDEVEITLDLLKPLEKPEPLSLTVESANTIIVKWTALKPKSGLEITYELFQDNELIYKGSDHGYVAQGLKPVTKYTFCMRTSTEGDQSPMSDQSTVTTQESVPSAPMSLMVAGRSTSQLKVSWQRPASPNGIVIRYRVIMRGLKNTSTDTVELYHIASGLRPGMEYYFEVYAVTSKGKGEAAILTAKTEDLGLHAPHKPTLTSLGRSEIFVQWDPPDYPLGKVNSYEVRISGKTIYSGSDRCCTARGLQSNTEYTFTVSAWTYEGRCESLPAKKKTGRGLVVANSARVPLYQSKKKETPDNENSPPRGLMRKAKTQEYMTIKTLGQNSENGRKLNRAMKPRKHHRGYTKLVYNRKSASSSFYSSADSGKKGKFRSSREKKNLSLTTSLESLKESSVKKNKIPTKPSVRRSQSVPPKVENKDQLLSVNLLSVNHFNGILKKSNSSLNSATDSTSDISSEDSVSNIELRQGLEDSETTAKLKQSVRFIEQNTVSRKPPIVKKHKQPSYYSSYSQSTQPSKASIIPPHDRTQFIPSMSVIDPHMDEKPPSGQTRAGPTPLDEKPSPVVLMPSDHQIQFNPPGRAPRSNFRPLSGAINSKRKLGRLPTPDSSKTNNGHNYSIRSFPTYASK